MPSGVRRRGLLSLAIPFAEQYAPDLVNKIAERYPTAAQYVGRTLRLGIGWAKNVAADENINPTFGNFLQYGTRQYFKADKTPPGTSELVDAINSATRKSQSQTPMGGLGSTWKYVSESQPLAPEYSKIVKRAALGTVKALTREQKEGEPEINRTEEVKQVVTRAVTRGAKEISRPPKPGTEAYHKGTTRQQKRWDEYWDKQHARAAKQKTKKMKGKEAHAEQVI